MGMFSFIKDAGAKIFGGGKSKEEAMKEHCQKLGLDPEKFSVTLDDDGNLKSVAKVKTYAEKEKLALALGNVSGVAAVDTSGIEVDANAASALKADDNGKDDAPDAESALYTVVKGDTLSAIAKKHYGNAMLYPKIFEANKPMLKHPDKIFPGQVLRIPPQ
jgi:nucleoid-associated protein YgaU